MQLFVDESGDPGMDKDGGASSCYIVATLVVASPEDMHKIEQALMAAKLSLRLPPSFEFRWSRNNERIRESVVAAIDPGWFRWRYCLCRKEHALRGPAELLGSAVAACLRIPPAIRAATLNIDGESTPLGVAQIFRQLRAGDHRNGPKALNKVRFLDSKRTPCLQLADYLAGMSGRWHRKKTPIATRWLRSLEGSEQN